MVRQRWSAGAMVLAAAVLAAPPLSAEEPAGASAWCAPELERLGDDVCYALPDGNAQPPTELVIFLHGVIAPEGHWQWAQQRAAARASAVHGIAALMPRGRRGLRTDSMKSWWTWPTGVVAQRSVEQEVLDRWWAAKQTLEERLGRPFERTYVFGFSNGAYYVSSLALRGRVAVDGFAAFAGGIAPKPIRPQAYAGIRRAPFYVGYGQRDTPAVRDAATLRRAFRLLAWPGKVVGRRRVGHVMTDAQVREALEFIRGTTREPCASSD